MNQARKSAQWLIVVAVRHPVGAAALGGILGVFGTLAGVLGALVPVARGGGLFDW